MRAHSPASIFAILAAVTLHGCALASDEIIEVVFDACEPLTVAPGTEPTAEEEESLTRATTLWNEVAATQLRTSRERGDLTILFEDGSPLSLGTYEDELGIIVINRSIADEAMTVTIAHEIGHAFGLVHVPRDERISVMNPGNKSAPPDDGDHGALRALWGDCEAAGRAPSRR